MPQTTTYEWDEENRLSAVVSPDGSREEYEYSADGLRRSKTIAAQTPEPQTTRFVWDGENLLQELSTNGDVRARYTYLAGGYGPLVSQRRLDAPSSSGALFNAVGFGSAAFNQTGSTPSTDPVSSFFGYDLSANTRFLNDAAGTVTDRYLDTAFGKEVLTSGTMKNPFRFGGAVGYYRDSAERDYVRARHLRNGRWISRDPIGFDGGDWNLYRYVENNPVNSLDPAGKARRDINVFVNGDKRLFSFEVLRKVIFKGKSYETFNGDGRDASGNYIGEFIVYGGRAYRIQVKGTVVIKLINTITWYPGQSKVSLYSASQRKAGKSNAVGRKVASKTVVLLDCRTGKRNYVPKGTDGKPMKMPANVDFVNNIVQATKHPFGGWRRRTESNKDFQSRLRQSWFYEKIRNHAVDKKQGKSIGWDYKQLGPEFEDFGNFNFGATGRAAGIPAQVLLRGAGAAQRIAHPNQKSDGHPLGRAPYGDTADDQKMIRLGIEWYDCCLQSTGAIVTY